MAVDEKEVLIQTPQHFIAENSRLKGLKSAIRLKSLTTYDINY